MHRSRRIRLELSIICVLLRPAVGQSIQWPQLNLGPAITGFSQPTYIANAGDGSGRLFVVEQGGTIRIVKNGVVQATTFLDIRSRVSCCGERGLLSMAFPPTDKAHFYVYYTNSAGDLVIARYFVTANPDVADPDSEVIVLNIPHPVNANHNGGQLAFGPDGYLYVGTGDGGSGGDPPNNAQNTDILLGKILRIDVESATTPYAIPATNPYAQISGYRPEIWAFGVRNPWRFSFDRQTHDLYIGDVGQGLYEEIDYQPASSAGGENYGWHVMEGLHCYNAATCTMAGLTLPVSEYTHIQGNCSVTGGFVYRAVQFPRMQGIYFYADYCTGMIWGLQQDAGTWVSVLLYDAPFNITTFGEDENGNLYVANATNGTIAMLSDPPTPTPTLTATTTPTATQTSTSPPTAPPTATSTPTVTRTRTPSGTPTPSATWTPTATVIPTATDTPPPTATATGASSIAGQIFYAGSGVPVSGVTVQLNGPTPDTAQSDSAGKFTFVGLREASWVIAPRKLQPTSSAITVADAVAVIQAIVGVRQLDAAQQLACDVNGDGRLTAIDALLIINYNADIIHSFPAADRCGSNWIFVPQPQNDLNRTITLPSFAAGACQVGSIEWPSLTGQATSQNFVAVLIGDCSGDWTPSNP